MSRQSVMFVALISVAVSLVSAQDIIFPGETDRPSRFPLTTPGPTPAFSKPPKIESATQPPVITTANVPNIEAYNQCILKCPATSEYNPVCGTDGVVYWNPGRLNCSFNCGNPVQLVTYGQCTSNIRG